MFDLVYKLNICPGGRGGGLNERVVEVFYGNRPYDKIKEVGSDFSLKLRLLAESGATLLYERGDDGSVLCSLRPAQQEFAARREEAILVRRYADARPLTGEYAIQRDWNDLIAYHAVTSLDGQATVSERLRVLVLTSVCHLVIEGQLTERRIVKWAQRVATWVLTVGISGVLLAIVQATFFASTSPTIQVDILR